MTESGEPAGVLDEGYIKFDAEWERGPATPWHKLGTLNRWRRILYDAGLIGALPDGIGFGNISVRDNPPRQFVITGSTTGNVSELRPEHFTRVVDYDFDRNKLWCRGPIIASSESLTHAAFYEAQRTISAVIHVHHAGLWHKYIDRLPTTSKDVTYGTPEMAYEIMGLLRAKDRPAKQLVIMGGHQDGVLAYGQSLGQAASTLLNCCDRMFRPGAQRPPSCGTP
ncbi:MAG: class II aldolase/adducin family protein [Rhodothermales bacterium]|nr:class II aldolase/adducin family protein [Rhodothermales bacterium]